jgi:hypothetical protein
MFSLEICRRFLFLQIAATKSPLLAFVYYNKPRAHADFTKRAQDCVMYDCIVTMYCPFILHLSFMGSVIEIDMGPTTENICLIAVPGRLYADF